MDRVVRGINAAHDIRVVTAMTTAVTREACRRHGIDGVEAVVLGRAITAGCLLATLTKNENERVRIHVQGDGPLGRILVDAHGDGTVRACLERRLEESTPPTNAAGRHRLGHLVGPSGHIVVTRDIGLEQEYQGVVSLATGELDEDLERYLGESEQLPSALACEVVLDANNDVLRCGGVLCQTFPGADPAAIELHRNHLRGGAFADLLRQERTAHDLMGFALFGNPYESKDGAKISFHCSCGRERAMRVLSTLGVDDLESLATEPGDTEVRCSFCGDAYQVSPQELLSLAAQLRQKRC